MVEPMVVAAYIEELTGKLSRASVKQHLAALQMLFDWLVVWPDRGWGHPDLRGGTPG